MKKLLTLCLCGVLTLPFGTAATSYGLYAEDNPFVEAMLRMMEIFGLINRSRLPLSVPYLPGYGQQLTPALSGWYGAGGFPGMSPMSGLGGYPGMSPISGLGGYPGMSPMSGLGGYPGMSPMSGLGGVPGIGSWPGAGGIPGSWYGPGGQGPGAAPTGGYLDGAWELSKGGFVVISGNRARLYLTPRQYQDFAVRYDRDRLWWAPRAGGATARYRYRVIDGRMVLRDDDGNYLLLRRRR